ncbi:MAG: cupin domain-containing protein [Pseudomonadota bacterium]
MQEMTAGVTPSGEGIDGISWNILGQTYVPMQLTESSFSWHATFPPGTFVPPHVHPDQDEFIYMLNGRFDLFLDGADASATNGDLIRLPRGIAHGIFNKSDHDVECIFWVSPTQKLWDLFHKIHNVPDPGEVVRLAAEHTVNFLPPPEEG